MAATFGRLGHLTPEQDQALTEFRKGVQASEYYIAEYHDDHLLLRFLRARKFQVEAARKMWDDCEKWRREIKASELADTFEYPEMKKVHDIYRRYYHKTDKVGRPVYIEHVGTLDTKKLFEVVTIEKLLQNHVYEYEKLIQYRFAACSKKFNRHIDQSCAILDLKGISLSGMPSVYNIVKQISEIGQNYYPELLGKMFIINAPMLFTAAWSVIKGWLDEVTVSKIEILGSSYAKRLLEFIDAENLPEALGGKSICPTDVLSSDIGPWSDGSVEGFPLARYERVLKTWFYATDVPKKDPRPFRSSIAKTPSVWVPFSEEESKLISQAVQSNSQDPNPVLEDHLFQVNVPNRELSAVYWDGPVFEVRSSIWFYGTTGNKWYPCDENLTQQIENGYKKFKPWLIKNDISLAELELSTEEKQKWALFGPYMNQSVVFVGQNQAFLLSELFTAKLAQNVITTITKGENLGGTRLVRGWDNVEKLKAQEKVKKERTTSDPKKEEESTEPTEPTHGTFVEREIQHVIFVVHGIGQKLSERVEAVNFVRDCNLLRANFQSSAAFLSSENAAIPSGGGVQILPIHWRSKIHVGGESDDGYSNVTLQDISLEGVPNFRTLISDVAIDVLLYLTPKYRQIMVTETVNEMNRIYKLFLERNPGFKGKVSILGHSLGSVIAFDILCNLHRAVEDEDGELSALPREVDLSEASLNSADAFRRAKRENTCIKYRSLSFPVQNFFATGSPVGLFMVLQEEMFGTSEREGLKPQTVSMYNFFHPHDPIAYRLEPLVKKSLSVIKPVYLPYTKGGLKGTINGISDYSAGIVDKGRTMIGSLYSNIYSTTLNVVNTKLMEMVIPSRTSVTSAKSSNESIEAHTETKEESPFKDVFTYNRHGRLDYSLQEGILENSYLSALGAHFSYWSEQDLTLFILKELYG